MIELRSYLFKSVHVLTIVESLNNQNIYSNLHPENVQTRRFNLIQTSKTFI